MLETCDYPGCNNKFPGWYGFYCGDHSAKSLEATQVFRLMNELDAAIGNPGEQKRAAIIALTALGQRIITPVLTFLESHHSLGRLTQSHVWAFMSAIRDLKCPLSRVATLCILDMLKWDEVCFRGDRSARSIMFQLIAENGTADFVPALGRLRLTLLMGEFSQYDMADVDVTIAKVSARPSPIKVEVTEPLVQTAAHTPSSGNSSTATAYASSALPHRRRGVLPTVGSRAFLLRGFRRRMLASVISTEDTPALFESLPENVPA